MNFLTFQEMQAVISQLNSHTQDILLKTLWYINSHELKN